MASRPITQPNTYGTIVGNAAMSLLDTSFNAVFTSGFNDSALGWVNYAADTGTANAYSCTLAQAPSAYVSGLTLALKIQNSNTGVSTLNVNALGTQTINDNGGNALTSGQLIAGQIVVFIYTGAAFQILDNTGYLQNQITTNVPYLTMPQALWGRKQVFDDFLFNPFSFTSGSVLSFGPFAWNNASSGVSSGIAYNNNGIDANNKVLGSFALSPGTTSTGYYNMTPSQNNFEQPALGILDIWFRFAVNTVPTSTQNTSFRFGIVQTGFANAWPATNQIDLLMFNNGTNAVWRGECVAAGTSSVTSDATTPTISAFSSGSLTYYKGHISINAAWNSVSFFVNGTQIGSAVTTNIPTTVLLMPVISVTNTAGTTNNSLYLDAYGIDYQYSSP